MYSRRQFGKIAVAAGVAGMVPYPALALAADMKSGVHVGLNTYSLRSIPHDGAVDTIIKAMLTTGITECELMAMHIEPPSQAPRIAPGPDGVRPPLTPEQQAAQKAAADALIQWRLTTPLDYFEGIRRKFNAAGLSITFYFARLGDTDEEIERTFVIAKALGAGTITGRVTLPMTQRIATFAEKHKMMVGIQSVDPDLLAQQIAMSKYLGIDLDIGDFTGVGHDALQYVRDNYTRFTDIHLKDKKLNGPSVPFGEGDSHMKEILQFLESKKPSVPVNIDCDYPGTGDSIEEIRKCYAYVQAALA
jgi:sugar phosphate isomerase/epimerase